MDGWSQVGQLTLESNGMVVLASVLSVCNVLNILKSILCIVGTV